MAFKTRRLLLLTCLFLTPYAAYSATTINPWLNQSAIAAPVSPQNFSPSSFIKMSVGASSTSVTFTTLTGTIRPTFVISNKGTNGAYIAWGAGSATAVASTGSPQANGHYIPAGVVETLDLQSSTGPTDTIAAIQDGGSTTLEISYGQGQ